MDEQLWVHVDHRGLSRQVEEHWIPHLNVEEVWLTSSAGELADPPSPSGATPIVRELSPVEIARLCNEAWDAAAQDRRVLVLFSSFDDLHRAVAHGLRPCRVTVVAHERRNGRRLSSKVTWSEHDELLLRHLEGQGFSFIVQALPNVTPRPLTLLRPQQHDTVSADEAPTP